MAQLIKISTTPIKLEFQAASAKLTQTNDVLIPKANVTITNGRLSTKSTPTRLRIDTYEARKSLGFRKLDDLISENAQKGKNGLTDYISKTVQHGRALLNIQNGTKSSDLIRQESLRQPMSQMVFLPSTGADISWDPGSLQIEYEPGTLNYEWNLQKPMFDFTPSTFDLFVTQEPAVDIEYLGQPNYFPKLK